MGYPTQAARGVRAVELATEDAFHFERLAHSLLDEALFEYDHFVGVDRRRVDAAQWRHWRQDDDIAVYRERHEGSGSLSASDSLLGGSHVEPAARLTAFASSSRNSKTTKAPTMPRLLAVGSLASSLDDVLYGTVTPTAATMRLRASYSTSAGDDHLDGAVLAQIRTPTPSEPFRFLGVKWVLQRGLGGTGFGLVRPRDFVFLESTGIQIRQDGSGQRVGFHIMHSVDLPQFAASPTHGKVQRGAFSACYLYHELANGAVDVYMTAAVQPRGNLIASMAVRAAASLLTTNWHATALFAESKKLAWLLETHRQLQQAPAMSSLLSSRCGLCSKSLKGFAKSKKRQTSCQLCAMTVCSQCAMTRTLCTEGIALHSVVSTEMAFCKKCIALAGEESASEIARQQLWERDIVRTGRAHTQTALALARRDTNGSRLFHQSLSMERGFATTDIDAPLRSTWHDTDPGVRRYHIYDDKTAPASASSSHRASTHGGAAVPRGSNASGASGKRNGERRRTTNSTWNGSGRPTETLSIGSIDYRASSIQDPARSSQHAPEEDDIRNSTASSALVLLDNRKSSRRMKALDYLPPSTEESATTTTLVATSGRRSSMASSVYTDGDDFDVESVYSVTSGTSSIAVLDNVDATRQPRSSMAKKPLTITEEAHEPQPEYQPRSELEAFYLEQQRQQKLQQQQLLERQQQMLQQHQYQTAPPRSSSSSRTVLETPLQNERRSSRVRFEDALTDVRSSEILPPRSSTVLSSSAVSSTEGEQRLSYQMQLWLQMNELRDTAESTFQITQRNTEAIASQNPQLFRDMRFFSQQPLGRTPMRRMTSATPTMTSRHAMAPPPPPPMQQQQRPVFSPMVASRRSSMPLSY